MTDVVTNYIIDGEVGTSSDVNSDAVAVVSGPQGPPGAPGGSRFELEFTNTSVVVVNHNLGAYVNPTIIVDGEEIEADVTYASINQLTVTFASPKTGRIVCS